MPEQFNVGQVADQMPAAGKVEIPENNGRVLFDAYSSITQNPVKSVSDALTPRGNTTDHLPQCDIVQDDGHAFDSIVKPVETSQGPNAVYTFVYEHKPSADATDPACKPEAKPPQDLAAKPSESIVNDYLKSVVKTAAHLLVLGHD